MNVVREGYAVRIEATSAEAGILQNALNEMCNAGHLEDWEFSTRMGATRDEVRAVLDALVLAAPIALGDDPAHE